ncbi:integrase core domain-containing protein [Nocardia tengchongensis]|uniref:integrase core domain-containing protein n=1 Tax=Nocardia tengchongensis TaxID=2055889 RepID=UPI00361473D7
MGATGICWDNASVESLWSTFKHECYYRNTYATRAELAPAVENWIGFYSHRRRHLANGMRSPIDYEQSLNAAPKQASFSGVSQLGDFQSGLRPNQPARRS